MDILIVEDDFIIAKHLRALLKEFGYRAEDVARDYDSAIELLKSKTFQLVILDINLEGDQTGIDVAAYIHHHLRIPFIFLSAHEDIAIINKALTALPHAFLSKPFHKITVYTAVKLALKNHRLATYAELTQQDEEQETTIIKDALFIKEKHSFIKILLADILYIRSDDNYLELHTKERKYTIRETMKNITSQLPGGLFFRVHKSFLVNLNAVTAINYTHVIVGKIEIPVTAANRGILLDNLSIFS